MSSATSGAHGVPGSTGRPRRRSGIPRSQGTSRETSPARYGYSAGTTGTLIFNKSLIISLLSFADNGDFLVLVPFFGVAYLKLFTTDLVSTEALTTQWMCIPVKFLFRISTTHVIIF